MEHGHCSWRDSRALCRLMQHVAWTCSSSAEVRGPLGSTDFLSRGGPAGSFGIGGSALGFFGGVFGSAGLRRSPLRFGGGVAFASLPFAAPPAEPAEGSRGGLRPRSPSALALAFSRRRRVSLSMMPSANWLNHVFALPWALITCSPSASGKLIP